MLSLSAKLIEDVAALRICEFLPSMYEQQRLITHMINAQAVLFRISENVLSVKQRAALFESVADTFSERALDRGLLSFRQPTCTVLPLSIGEEMEPQVVAGPSTRAEPGLAESKAISEDVAGPPTNPSGSLHKKAESPSQPPIPPKEVIQPPLTTQHPGFMSLAVSHVHLVLMF
jgi:hypothetical protein